MQEVMHLLRHAEMCIGYHLAFQQRRCFFQLPVMWASVYLCFLFIGSPVLKKEPSRVIVGFQQVADVLLCFLGGLRIL